MCAGRTPLRLPPAAAGAPPSPGRGWRRSQHAHLLRVCVSRSSDKGGGPDMQVQTQVLDETFSARRCATGICCSWRRRCCAPSSSSRCACISFPLGVHSDVVFRLRVLYVVQLPFPNRFARPQMCRQRYAARLCVAHWQREAEHGTWLPAAVSECVSSDQVMSTRFSPGHAGESGAAGAGLLGHNDRGLPGAHGCQDGASFRVSKSSTCASGNAST